KGLPSVTRVVKSQLQTRQMLFRLLVDLKLFPSNSEAQRKIKEGAVYMAVGKSMPPAWQKLTDPTWNFDPGQHPLVIFRIGRQPPVTVEFPQIGRRPPAQVVVRR